MKEQILKDFHDNKFRGHVGSKRTYEHIRTYYYWPNMREEIDYYCKTCHSCQINKFKNRAIVADLQPIEVNHPFERIGMDCIGPLPVTVQGNRYILIFTDYFTKYTVAHALTNITTPKVVQIFVDYLICHFGAPMKLHSDLGTNFTSALLEEITALCHTEHVFTTAYHPQANGQVERQHQTLVT